MGRPPKNIELERKATHAREALRIYKAQVEKRIELLKELSEALRNVTGQVAAIQSLVYAATSDQLSSEHITKKFLATLTQGDDWPQGLPRLSSHNVNDFCVKGMIPKDILVIMSYSYILFILIDIGHPCFANHIASHLLTTCPAVDLIRDILSDKKPKNSEIKTASIINRGRDLIGYLGIEKRSTYDSIEAILSTPFLKDRVLPYNFTHDSERAIFCALRLAPAQSIAKYAGSNCRIALVNSHSSMVPGDEQFLYIETTVSDEKGNQSLVSSGYMVPMGSNVYIFQSKISGVGVNISVIPLSEFLIENANFIRGIMLTIDTDHETGPLLSRIIFSYSNNNEIIEKSIDRFNLKRGGKFYRIFSEEVIGEIYNYLNNLGYVKIYSPIIGMTQATTWGDIRRIIEDESFKPEFDGEALTGYRPAPIRALS